MDSALHCLRGPTERLQMVQPVAVNNTVMRLVHNVFLGERQYIPTGNQGDGRCVQEIELRKEKQRVEANSKHANNIHGSW